MDKIEQLAWALLDEAFKNGNGIITDHTGTAGRPDYDAKKDQLHRDAIEWLEDKKYLKNESAIIYKLTSPGWGEAEKRSNH